MTSGNETPDQRHQSGRRTGATAERFIVETLALIDERGGSLGVNLREVARRVGCAHTNVYNYYASFEDLRWAAFRRALHEYGEFLSRDLHDSLPPAEYLRRLITSLAVYPQKRPGRSRFLGSDPLDVEHIPADVLQSVVRMKAWAVDVFRVCLPALGDGEAASRRCDIVLAYIDGETFNLINGRVVPGEDVRGRIVENALRLFVCLAAGGDDMSGVGELVDREPPALPYPRLRLEDAETATRH